MTSHHLLLVVTFLSFVHATAAAAGWPEFGRSRRATNDEVSSRGAMTPRKRMMTLVASSHQYQTTGRTRMMHTPNAAAAAAAAAHDEQQQQPNPNAGDFVERLFRDLEEVLDDSDNTMTELSFSLSMSIVSPPIGNPSAPSVPTIVSPTPSPTLNHHGSGAGSTIPSDFPSLAPTGISNFPTAAVDTLDPPTVADNNPSTATVAPTAPPGPPLPVFDCSDNNGGLSLGFDTDSDATEIFLVVGYRAESTSNSTEDFEEELERQLLETAVLAALGGCNADNGGDGNLRTRRRGRELLETEWTTRRQRHLMMVNSLTVGSCEASLNKTEACTIMETEMLFHLKGAVDPDVAAYASYTAIEELMVQDKYIGIVPTVLRLEYLSPLPLVPPPTGTTPTNSTDWSGANVEPAVLKSTTATGDGLSVSPWTIGACVATICGGVISLLVYRKNNRPQRRHVRMTQEHHNNNARRARNPVTI